LRELRNWYKKYWESLYNLWFMWLFFFFLACWIISPVCVDFLYSKVGYREVFRKLLHLFGGVFFIFMFTYLSILEVMVIGGIIFVSFVVAKRFWKISLLIWEKRRGQGEIFFILGLMPMLWVAQYSLDIAKIWIFVLTFADGLAPFGRYLWSKKLYSEKSFGWTFLFFFISLIIFTLYYWLKIKLVFVAIILSLIELFLGKGIDNLVLPIATVGLFYMLRFI